MTVTIPIQATTEPSTRPYQICSRTIMDTTDSSITFDEDGVCDHYHNYFNEEARYVRKDEAGSAILHETAERIRKHGLGRKYDCILGLSGGVDSTYLCLLAKELNLNPLVVHFDNGWNSELAVCNIENTVKRLGFDLYTYVVDWPEFRDLQRSYFKANVVDIEVLTDHGFMAVLYQQAMKHRIRFVLAGMNIVTEAILPQNWIYDKSNLVNIKEIQRQFGTIPPEKLRSYPMLSPHHRRFYDRVLRLEVVSPLNYVDYSYDNVKARITEELAWREYGGKHYESLFTRFYQGYILPRKFGFDKRRAHLSTLICSGQITREEAMRRISQPGYPQEQCDIDRPFVLKKLGFSEDEFEQYLAVPRVEHNVFGAGTSLYNQYPVLKPLRPIVNLIFRRKSA